MSNSLLSFVLGDYRPCLTSLLNSLDADEVETAWVVSLICLQRLGESTNAQSMQQDIAGESPGSQNPMACYGLILLGHWTAEEIPSHLKQEALMLYCLGARALWNEQFQEAEDYLQRALQTADKHSVRQLAEGDLRRTRQRTSVATLGLLWGQLNQAEAKLLQGQREAGLDLAVQIRQRAERELHSHSVELARIFEKESSLQYFVGNRDAARARMEDALVILRERYPHPSLEIAEAQLQMANLLGGCSEWELCLAHSQQAQNTFQSILEHSENLSPSQCDGLRKNIADCLGVISNVYFQERKHEQAHQFAEQALAIRQEIYGDDHLEVARSYNDLGANLPDRKEAAKAKEYLTKALQIRRQHLGEHDDVAQTLNNLGSLAHRIGETEEAISYFQEALQIRRRLWGERHPALAVSYTNLGFLLLEAPHQATASVREEAFQALRTALEIREETLGEDHPQTSDSRRNLAQAYCNVGQYGNSRVHWEKLAEILARQEGADSPAVEQVLASLVDVARQENDLQAALPWLVKQLRRCCQRQGRLHPETRNILGTIAETVSATFQPSETKLQALLRHFAAGDFRLVFNRFLDDGFDSSPAVLRLMLYTVQMANEAHGDQSWEQCLGLFPEDSAFVRGIRILNGELPFPEGSLGPNPPNEECILNFACGLKWLRVGDPESAASHFAAAGNQDAQGLMEHFLAVTILEGLEDPAGPLIVYLDWLIKLSVGTLESEPLPLTWLVMSTVVDVCRILELEQHPAYATALANQATALMQRGDFESAVPILRNVIELQADEDQAGGRVMTMHNLAECLQQQGKLVEAKELLEQILEIKEALYGRESTTYTNSLMSLGYVYHRAGEFGPAAKIFDQLGTQQLQQDPVDYRKYAENRILVAGYYCRASQVKDAEKSLAEARQVIETELAETDTSDLELDRTQAKIHLAAERYDMAAEILMPLFEQGSMDDDPALLTDLAICHSRTGNPAGAVPFLERALEETERQSGRQSREFLIALENLIGAWRDSGETARAERLDEQARQLRRHLRQRQATALDSNNPALESLFAFARGEYDHCVKTGYAYVGRRDYVLPGLLVLMSLQRLGREKEAASLTSLIWDRTSESSRERVMLDLVCDQIPLDRALEQAQDDIARFRMRFYAGCRQWTLGQFAAARDLWQAAQTAANGEKLSCLEEPLLELLLMRDSESFPALNPDAISQTGGESHDLSSDLDQNDFSRLFTLAKHLYEEGRLEEALEAAEQARRIAYRQFGREDEQYAVTLELMAVIYQVQENWSQSESLLGETLEIKQELFGKRSAEAAITLDNLAMLHSRMQDHEKADEISLEALAIFQSQDASASRDFCICLDNRAQILYHQGRIEEAIQCTTKGLDVLTGLVGETHPSTAVSLHNLGLFQFKVKQWAEAKSNVKRALEIRRQVLPDDHVETYKSLDLLSKIVLEEENWPEAVLVLEEMARLSAHQPGRATKQYALDVGNLGFAIDKLGDWPRAEQLCLEALEVHREVSGETSEDYQSVLNFLVSRYREGEQHQKADELLQQQHVIDRVSSEDLEILRPLLKDFSNRDYSSVIAGLQQLMQTRQLDFQTRERLSLQILPYWLISLQRMEHFATVNYHQIVESVREKDSWLYAILQFLQGRLSREELKQQATTRNARIQYYYYSGAAWLTELKPDLALPEFQMANELDGAGFEKELARLELEDAADENCESEPVRRIQAIDDRLREAIQMQDFARAIPLGQQLRAFAEKLLGPDSPHTVTITSNLATAYMGAGHHEEAESLVREVVQATIRLEGKESLNYARDLHNLSGCLITQEKFEEAMTVLTESLALKEKLVGKEHVSFATGLANLAQCQNRLGHLEEAAATYLQSIEIERQVGQVQTLDHASSLQYAGEVLTSIGRFSEAEELLRQARELYLHFNHPQIIPVTINLAKVYEGLCQLARAQELLQQLASSIHGTRHAQVDHAYARCLLNLGSIYRQQGRLTDAEPLLRQSRKLFEASVEEDHPLLVDALYEQAEATRQSGALHEAETLFQRVTSLARSLPETSPLRWMTINGLANVWREQGRIEQALDLVLSSLMQCEDLRSLPIGVIVLSGTLSDLYQENGNYNQAAKSLSLQEELIQTQWGRQHPEFARVRIRQSQLNQAIQDLPRARRLLEEARDLLKEWPDLDPLILIQTDGKLARLLKESGELDEALRIALHTVDRCRKLLPTSHPEALNAEFVLAEIYLARGEGETAEPLLKRFLDEKKTTAQCAHLSIDPLVLLARFYRMTGRYEAARTLLQQAIDVQQSVRGLDHLQHAALLSELSQVLSIQDQPDEARELLQQAMHIEDNVIGEVFTISSDRQRMAFLHRVQQNQFALLALACHHKSEANLVRHAFDVILRRKLLSSEALTTQRNAVLSGAYPDLEDRINALTELKRTIGQLTLHGFDSGEAPMDVEQTLADLVEKREKLESELATKIPEMNLLKGLGAINRQRIVESLPSNSCLVEFVKFSSPAEPAKYEYAAFVVHAGNPDSVRLISLGDTQSIDPQIARFREQLMHPEPADNRGLRVVPVERTDLTAIGLELFKVIFAPLQSSLREVRRLFIAPDGDLARLPLEVLPTPSGKYVLDEYRISYLACGRDLLRLNLDSFQQGTAPVIVADPDFDLAQESRQEKQPAPAEDSSVSDLLSSLAHQKTRHGSRQLPALNSFYFHRLEGTLEEGLAIGELLQTKPWLAADALKGKLKAVKSPWILHIATHGFFLEPAAGDSPVSQADQITGGGRLPLQFSSNPLLRSGLALAAANSYRHKRRLPEGAEDGLLTSEDVTGMNLLATELVVLSACETGLGEIHIGEGVLGLRRSFMLAGAKSLVISLWKVDDFATRELMIQFYKRLQSGESRMAALRGAQLALREKFPHPFYWGAFILQGAPGPLSNAPGTHQKQFAE